MKKFIILLLMTVLLAGAINAATIDDIRNKMQLYLNGSNSASGNALDGSPKPYAGDSDFAYGGVNAEHKAMCAKVGDYGFWFNGNSYLQNNSQAVLNATPSDLTVCTWFNTTSANFDYIMRWYDAQVGDGQIAVSQDDFSGQTIARVDSINAIFTNTTWNNGNWHWLCNVADATAGTVNLYVDNAKYASGAGYDGNPGGGAATFYIGYRDDTMDWEGCIDEFTIFTKNLTKAEMDYIWNNGAGISLEAGSGGSAPGGINVTILYPANGANFSAGTIGMSINVTHNETGNVSCGLNTTIYSLSYNTSSVWVFSNNTIVPSGTNSILAFCNKTGTTNGTATVTFYYDIVNPVITTSFSNGTIAYYNNLTGQFNFSDDYALWSYNITIDGTSIANANGLSVASYSYNLSYNISSLSIGQHTLGVITADGHTSKYIDEYRVEKGGFNNYLKYYKKNTWIKLSAGLFDSWDTQKLTDRYTFDFVPLSKSNKYTFNIQSNYPINIIDAPNTPWKTWLIINDQWMDFDITDEDENIKITRINNYEVNVEISNLKIKDKIKFNSIGDLNVVHQEFTFITTNATTTYESNLLEREIATFTLNLTKNSTASTKASFWLNGIIQTGITNTSSDYSDYYTIDISMPISSQLETIFNFNWSFNMTSGAGTSNYWINETGNYSMFVLADCNGTYNTTIINFSVIDANLLNGITGYVYEASFNVWHTDNVSYTKNYGMTLLDRNLSNAICMYPEWATLKTSYDSLFSHLLYDDTHYIKANHDIDNLTEFVTISMVNSSLATGITITIIDENGNVLVDYIIEAWRYDLGSNNYTLITTQYSDSKGQAKFYLDVTTYEYRFIIKDSLGTIVHTEAKQKLIDTEYTFIIPIGTTQDMILAGLNGLDITLTANRNTKTFTLTWNDINWAASRINLTVVRSNSSVADIILSNQNSTDNSGSLTYTVVELTTNISVTYIGRVYLVSVKDSKEYYITSESMDFKKEWDLFGNESLLMSFIFIGTMMFIGVAVSPVVALVLTILSMMMLWWLGFYMVSLSGLIAIIVAMVVVIMRMNR